MAVDVDVDVSPATEARASAPASTRTRVRALARPGGRPIGRWLLTAAVVAWFSALILVPALALIRGALAGGVRPFLEALAAPEARQAFGLTMAITLLAAAVNTAFGLALAMVLVRHRFWGKTLADGL